jgi:hypothetical protein
VPLFLGTPWIDRHAMTIEPRTRELLMEFSKGTPLRIPLLTFKKSAVIRVATPRCIPAFSETLVKVRSNRTGLSVLRPPNKWAQYVQLKWFGLFAIHRPNIHLLLLIYERENKPCFYLELSHIQFINYSLHIVDIFHISCHDISIVITSLVTRTTHIYSNTMCRALLLIIACVYIHLTVF